MDVRFTLTTVNVAGLDSASARAADLTPAMLAIASYLETEVDLRFETASGPDGKPWLPSLRAREGKRGGLTLTDIGHLRERITSQADATSAEVGTNVPYANIHNSGGTIRPRSGSGKRALKTPFGARASVAIPQRQFIDFSDADRIEIPQLLADHLAGVGA